MFFLYKIVSRLVPVAIVVFRYLMVCQAVWCQNLGGERFLWRIVSHHILPLQHIYLCRCNDTDTSPTIEIKD